MNMTLTPLRKEKGVVLVLVALSLVVLMGMAALAIDLSHAEVNKTRLQNLADALALSAAISLNKGSTDTAAQAYAITNTLPKFLAALGNNELNSTNANLTADNLRFTFATNAGDDGIWVAANNSKANTFVRVTMINSMSIPTWFAPIFDLLLDGEGINNIAVSASAVAGTTPINPCLNVLPIMMCTTITPPPIDKNCDNDSDTTGYNDSGNNDCFGYELNVVYETKQSKWQSDDIGPGNFGYFDVGSGGSAIKDCLAGDPGCTKGLCSLLNDPNGTVSSEPGSKVGPGEQGLNTRFDVYKGSVNYTYPSPPDYRPDSLVRNSLGITLSTTGRVVGHEFDPAMSYNVPPSANPSAQIYSSYYKDHYSSTSDLSSGHLPIPGRRLVTLPFVKCIGDGTGTTPMEIAGLGCWFLTSPSDGKIIYAEFLGTDGCNNSGPTTSTNDFGFYKVQLYKDPFGGHS